MWIFHKEASPHRGIQEKFPQNPVLLLSSLPYHAFYNLHLCKLEWIEKQISPGNSLHCTYSPGQGPLGRSSLDHFWHLSVLLSCICICICICIWVEHLLVLLSFDCEQYFLSIGFIYVVCNILMIGYLLTKVANFQPPLLVLGLLVKVISEHLEGLLVKVIYV